MLKEKFLFNILVNIALFYVTLFTLFNYFKCFKTILNIIQVLFDDVNKNGTWSEPNKRSEKGLPIDIWGQAFVKYGNQSWD